MNDVPRISEALEGYGDLASDLEKKWTPFLKQVAVRANDGVYTQTDAEADFPAFAKVVADSLFLTAAQAVRALSILTGDFSTTQTVDATAVDDATTTRKLSVADDFVSVTKEVLPKSRLTMVPDTLAPGEKAFKLVIQEDGMKARTFDGVVVATVTDPSGGTFEYPQTVTIG